MRDFNTWLSTFRESICDYKYYVSFENVYRNTDEFKIELHLLNSLIGSKNIEKEFETLVDKYPEVLKAIPILLAKRETEIYCIDDNGGYVYDFAKRRYSLSQYTYFMRETGLFDLMAHRLINNLYDYVLGVNAGLDSNGRKNRGGHLMEDLVEKYIIEAGFVKGQNYYKELYSYEVEKITGIDLSAITNNGQASKRFDYVIVKNNHVYGIECNFYTGGGSKLNETARSYKMISEESKNIDNFTFVWFTDGIGWISARKNLKETFDVLPTMYNICDLEAGIIQNL